MHKWLHQKTFLLNSLLFSPSWECISYAFSTCKKLHFSFQEKARRKLTILAKVKTERKIKEHTYYSMTSTMSFLDSKASYSWIRFTWFSWFMTLISFLTSSCKEPWVLLQLPFLLRKLCLKQIYIFFMFSLVATKLRAPAVVDVKATGTDRLNSELEWDV